MYERRRNVYPKDPLPPPLYFEAGGNTLLDGEDPLAQEHQGGGRSKARDHVMASQEGPLRREDPEFQGLSSTRSFSERDPGTDLFINTSDLCNVSEMRHSIKP